MKSLKEVCQRLEPKFRPLLDAYRFEGEEYQDILLYKDFETLMMADGWILSDKTVQTKWKLLERNGIITVYAKNKAFIDVKGLAKALGYTPYVGEKKIKKKFVKGEPSEEATQ